MAESYYDVLGVPPDASREEIESAYRERVLETHPDHNDDPDAAEAFKRVTDAQEVLTDETERARYDRLGHEAYVRFTERFGAAGASAGGDDRADGGEDGARSTRGTADARSSTDGSTSTTGGRTASSDRTDGRSRERGAGTSAGSHHARQRARRQRAKRRHAAGHRSGRQRTERRERERADRTRERRRKRTRSRHGRTATEAGDEDPEEGTDSFRYSVHEWDEDDVSVEDDRPSIDHHTAVFLACLTVLYPMLVYSSVAAAFPLVVNTVVAACTLCLIGYLLTMPRIAVVAFGAWSLLAPAAAWRLEALEVTLVTAAMIVGGFWIPFGYALVVRRVLRP